MDVSRRRSGLPSRLLLAGLVATLAGEAGAAAAWEALPSGLERRLLPAEGEAAPLTLVRSPTAGPVRLRARWAAGGLRVSELVNESRVLAAVNANFFDAGQRPLGWVVCDGVEHSALSREGWGVLSVDAGGVTSIRRPARVEPGEPVLQAVQAGPLLVEDGRANPGLKTQSARRVFVGLDAEGRLVLGSTGLQDEDAPRLAARLALAEAEGGAGLVTVLNLDGGSSAQLYVRGGLEEGDLHEPGFVRVPVLLTLEVAD